MLLATGCAPRPLLARAIRARGGPLPGLVERIDARVYAGAPGPWEWQRAFLLPDRYAWVITTATEADSYLFDGRVVRAFIGTRPVSVDPDPAAPLRSHARWTAVVNLDALALPGVAVAPLPPSELPPGTREGLTVVWADDGARYRLAFDERTLLVWASGSLDLSPITRGDVTARFADFRRAGGLLLPFHTTYAEADAPLAEERVQAACPDAPGLGPDAFLAPGRLPPCP
ncbi:MAG TPA: hypothetical protein VKZ18_15835 [Polyangia bacterium]|nr:hypothetical protein [Polyangia bacterium]